MGVYYSVQEMVDDALGEEFAIEYRRRMWWINWRSILVASLTAAIVLTVVAFSQADDNGFHIPSGFTIPEPEVSNPTTFRIVPSSSARPSASGFAKTPMDASVIVKVSETQEIDTRRAEGSGTAIADGYVLTCWHVVVGDSDATTIEVVYRGATFPAQVVKKHKSNDLALLKVSAAIPFVRVVDQDPNIGQSATSIGRTENGLGEWNHSILSVDSRHIITSVQHVPGRSGGGLFVGGELVGVVQARFTEENKSLYASTQAVREFLDGAIDKPSFGSTKQIEWRKWTDRTVRDAERDGKNLLVYATAKWCKPCKAMEQTAFADGRVAEMLNGFVCVKFDGEESPDLLNGFKVTSYPTLCVVNPDRTIVRRIVGGRSAGELVTELSEYSMVSAGPVGAASFEGWSIVQSWLKTVTEFAGDGATAKLLWVRHDAASALLVGKKSTRQEVLGKSGRIEFTLKSAAKLPIHELKFNYDFDANGKPFIDLDRIGIDLPEGYGSGEVKPVGSVTLIAFAAWEILSWGYTLYELLSPQISIWPGDRIEAVATVHDGGIAVDFGSRPPAIHADWSLLFGLINVEYQRSLTGVVVTPEHAVAQFHKSRIYRDVTIVGK